MNIKASMKASDYHLVIQTKSLRFKVFSAKGVQVYAGVLALHPGSPAENPVPSQGQCVLAAQANGEFLHVSHLGSYRAPAYVDVVFTRAGTHLTDRQLKNWAKINGVIYEISDLEFQELLKLARNFDSTLSGAAMDQQIAFKHSPVVYVSYA